MQTAGFVLFRFKDIMGPVALVAGLLCLIKVIYERKNSVKVPGKIVNFVVENGNYFPVIAFVYNGEQKAIKGANGSASQKGNVGDDCEVLYRPGNEKYVNLTGSNIDIIISVGLVICGAILTAILFLK